MERPNTQKIMQEAIAGGFEKEYDPAIAKRVNTRTGELICLTFSFEDGGVMSEWECMLEPKFWQAVVVARGLTPNPYDPAYSLASKVLQNLFDGMKLEEALGKI